MKLSLRSSLLVPMFGLLVSTAQASPISYTQEHNSDGTVTTTASDNSGAVHDQTREQGEQTKQDLERQGFEVNARSSFKDINAYVPKFEECDGLPEVCNPPVNPCSPAVVCESAHPSQCYEVLYCRPNNIIE